MLGRSSQGIEARLYIPDFQVSPLQQAESSDGLGRVLSFLSAHEVKTCKTERLMIKEKERDETVKLVLDSSMKLESS